MNWALITQTLEGLETLSAEDLAKELSRLNSEDAVLASAVAQLHGNRKNAASFMQTHMPGSQQRDGATLELGARIGIWQIEALLGAGGMGEVYRATRADGLFDQQVALKISRRMGDEFAARFEAERQRLAQLEHPNIARIVDGGTTENGSPYMTMEFVEGHPIDQHVGRNLLDRSGRLGLIVRLCTAVAHAHGRLVLHRDIKHDNVLINLDGELRLIDFGVASLIGDVAKQGGFSSLTPAYAAPEQLTGNAVSAATDTFAIGMLAHLLETGALPKRQPDGGVMIDSAAMKDTDLSAILSKATATDPVARYGSVDALGSDLQNFLDDMPVAARDGGAAYRLRKLIVRYKAAASLGLLLIVSLVAGLMASLFLYDRALEENERFQRSEKQSAVLSEFYETSAKGFGQFIAGLDFDSPPGKAMLSAFVDAETSADQMEGQDLESAAQIYVFLSDMYADAGMLVDSGRVAQKLADPKFEQNFAKANTLLNAALFASGGEDIKKAASWLDISHDFFATQPDVFDYELVWSSCVKSRLTSMKNDQEECLNSAVEYLSTANGITDMEVQSSRTIQAYAVDESIRLGQLQLGEKIATEALIGFDEVGGLTGVPEAAFHLQLAKIRIAQDRLPQAYTSLIAARASVKDSPQFVAFDAAISSELASLENKRSRYTAASKEADRALDLALMIYGPRSQREATAKAQKAIALAGRSRREEAVLLMEEALEIEMETGSDSSIADGYRQWLARWQND